MQVIQSNTENREAWEDIAGYEGIYQVSSLGKVRSLDRIETHKSRWGNSAAFSHKGRVLKQKTTNNGYKVVYLNKTGKTDYKLVHRLVATAFLQNDANLPCVNHKDCNTANNSVNNLEWCDYSYNSQYMFKNSRAKGAVKEARGVRNSIGECFDSINDAARHYGNKHLVSKISECCRGLRKTAYGLNWEYTQVAKRTSLL